MLARYSFLLRFGALTLVLSVAAAIVLSNVLSRQQQAQVDHDLIYSAVARASEDFTPVMSREMFAGRISDAQYAALAKIAQQLTNADAYIRGVRLYRPDGTAILPAASAPQAGEVAKAIVQEDVLTGPVHRMNGERIFTIYAPFANPSGPGYSSVIAIDFSRDQLDVQDNGTKRFVFTVTWGACAVIFISLFALALAAQRELNRRARLAAETFRQTMTGIAAIVDQRDPYTAGHSKRVAEYAVKLANRMRLSSDLVARIEAAALLHDLGKIGVSDAVLLKPARLDDAERAEMQEHPKIAAEILRGIEAMHDIVPCILHHHERWDGRGYPMGIAADSIPLGARVIAVADTYDAMTTDRPYRRALQPEQAREELLRGAGVQWDARSVEHFLTLIDDGSVPPPTPARDESELANAFGRHASTGSA